ncbi:MAG: membrane dipeptidase [Acidobacteria bacterium]|nr:membrane dipeptidase [Acidobacteriota bacterium]MBV9478684.1 membrane dipeptidase [Acidobacteriota bacterium]
MLNRREFAAAAVAASVSLAVPRRAAAADPSLYDRALVIDMNTAPPVSSAAGMSKDDLAMLRDSGVRICKTTIGGFGSSFTDTVDELAFWSRVIEEHPDALLQVRTVADIDRAQRERKSGMIFSFEGIAMLDGQLDRITLFRNLGVRVMQLSYNIPSPFGSGVLAKGGLTELGRAAITRMNETGVALDLSHANEETSLAALAATTKTPILSHGGCAAVHAHPRNKSDALLKAAAAKGAVLGIYMLPYIAASPKQPATDDYLAHMTHALAVMGEDHVGIGTDVGMEPFDTSAANMAAFQRQLDERKKAGVSAPEEDRPTYLADANVPRKLAQIADGLAKRGVASRVIEKILGTNFRRALSEAWGA